MAFSDVLSDPLLFPAQAGARFAATVLVGALLLRFSGPGALHLRSWGVAWLSLGAQVLGSIVEGAGGRNGVAWLEAFGAVIVLAGAYVFGVALILGRHDLPEQAEIGEDARRALFAGAGLLAAASLLGLVLGPASGAGCFLRADLPHVFRTTASSIVAIGLVRSRPRFASGRWLVTASLVAQVAFAITQSIAHARDGASLASGMTGVVLVGLMGLGMLACLLDDDRDELARASREARRVSDIDPVTGLANKSAFVRTAGERVDATPRGDGLAIVFVALNRIGSVNQSLGHAAGDRLLRSAGERLLAVLRDGDVVGRVGGDEFAVLADGISREEDAIAVARKLDEALRRAFEIDDAELSISASIGVSVYPRDAHDAAVLLDRACTAAYGLSEKAGGRIGLFEKGMNSSALERLALERDLRRAIEQGDLTLHFQPLFRVADGAICAVEALLRWNHPRHGLLGAEPLIRVAEATGLIDAIGRWALKVACAQVEEWRTDRPGLRLNVNVSARQLMAGDLVEQVHAALQETGLPAAHLEVEITETAAIDNVAVARDQLKRLKRMGVSIAVDDFGTGYSSLAYLKNLPLDTIKIDRSFVRDIADDVGDSALVTTIIALAHGRDLRVVAEGVETHEQFRFLAARGCDYAQGYLLARPLPPEDFHRVEAPALFSLEMSLADG